jgi:ABC-type multidrug transport system fused ATPase/permease subunit
MNDVERVDAYRRLESEKYVARPSPVGSNGQRQQPQNQWASSTSLIPASADTSGARRASSASGGEDEQLFQVLPSSWPQNGKVVFDQLRLCYPSNPTVAVLKDLSFTVQGRERVGIVGRTGAGKSSLAVALFRMVEPSSGKINQKACGVCERERESKRERNRKRVGENFFKYCFLLFGI